MLKSLLIGIDGSESSDSAIELGLRWARQFNALAVGIGIVDQPGIFAIEPVGALPGYKGYDAQLAYSRGKVKQFLERFSSKCSAADVPCTLLEDMGRPHEQIVLESQRFDLILIGRLTYFRFKTQDGPDETLAQVLKDSPRPVVSVPKELGADGAVIVAYDGSLQASRALYAFEALGFAGSRDVHVVTVDTNRRDAVRNAGRAVEFLGFHGIKAVSHAIDTSVATAEVILKKVRQLDAGLLVMGAYGQPVLREFFLGSVTRTVLTESPVPVFCYH